MTQKKLPKFCDTGAPHTRAQVGGAVERSSRSALIMTNMSAGLATQQGANSQTLVSVVFFTPVSLQK
jgi:hypothetical protein